ncbi:MAG: hypothetical protein IKA31_00705, partial [Clostridia bacterium]|nr:hypothetical protein [Clostridia bacterium]
MNIITIDNVCKNYKVKKALAAGISPSGSIHIGNFRDIATSYFVYKALIK